jgi:hypothetical protein
VEGGQLLVQAGLADSVESGTEKVRATLRDGSALAKFKAMLVAQGVTAEMAAAVTEVRANLLASSAAPHASRFLTVPGCCGTASAPPKLFFFPRSMSRSWWRKSRTNLRLGCWAQGSGTRVA